MTRWPDPSPPGRRARLRGPALAAAVFLLSLLALCVGSLPWAFRSAEVGADARTPRLNAGSLAAARLPPFWVRHSPEQSRRLRAQAPDDVVARIADAHAVSSADVRDASDGPLAAELAPHLPRYCLGTDALGRSLLVRALAGGGISLTIGLAAAAVAVGLGTLYGAVAGYAGGRTDAVMMRAVDVLFGLPYVLLVVLLAIAGDSLVGEYVSRQRERAAWIRSEEAAHPGVPHDELVRTALERVPPRDISEGARRTLDLATLLVAIGGVSWLTMARVIRGQVLSLKSRPFVEAARAMGASPPRVFFVHLLPNLTGPILVYATLTVPQAILQESFLSFLGIGVKPPLPSWGVLAADGLGELNPYESNWWLLAVPCTLLALTLLALNFVGEGLRESIDARARS